MYNPNANWGSASEPFAWPVTIEIVVLSGNNVITGDKEVRVAEVVSPTEIKFDKSIKATPGGSAPSNVDYFLRDQVHGDLIQHGIGGDSPNVTIRGNKLYDIGNGWSYMHLQVQNPGNPDRKIGGYNWLIENNLCGDTPGDADEESGNPLNVRHINGLVFRNNIVIGRVQIRFDDNVTLVNNIISYIDVWGDSDFIANDYNIFNRGVGPDPIGEYTTFFNPGGAADTWNDSAFTSIFADYANGDFRHASANSLGVGHGDPENYPISDILGASRVFPPDAGCYEYISGTPDTTPPSTPQNLNAQAVSKSQIDLSWDISSDPESGISYYKIYRDNNQIDTSVSASYSDTNLASETNYSYKVSAVNGAGLESNQSNIAQATTLVDTTTAPSIVSVNASETLVEVVFNGALDTLSAENINNYSINNNISVISASLDINTVTLTTSTHTEGTYTLTVVNVKNTSDNPIPQTSIDYEYNQGLVGYWKFDDSNGTGAVDSSGNSNTATLVNGPTWTTGRIDGALSFDGVDDAVEIPTANWNVNNGTVSLWAYTESFPASQYLFGHTTQPAWANRIQLYTDDIEGYLDLGLGDSHSKHTNIQDLDTHTWYHITLTWDGTNYVVYVDGAAKATGTYAGLSTLETYADIGNNGNGSDKTEAFNGIIDEVRAYNQALTADEVLSLFNKADSLVFSPIGDKEVNEGSELTFEIITTEPNIVVDINDHNLPSDPNFFSNIFSWTPAYGDAGSYEVTFEAPDGNFIDFETITITVNNVNSSPVLTSIANQSVSENETLSFTVNASDDDGDTITYSAQNLPAGALFSGNSFTWIPTSGQAGTYQVTFIASDGQTQDSEIITITVNTSTTTNGLVGHWNMNDSTANTTVADGSGKGNHGTARKNTSALSTTGKIDGALTFNGTSDYVNCGNNSSLDITDAITISAWVKFNRLGIDQGIVDKGFNNISGVIRLWIWSGNNKVYFDAPEGTVRINGAPVGGFSINTWYHIVATYDKNAGPNNLNLYINGTNVATSTDTDAMGTNNADLIIGARKQGSGEFFSGLIDNVMIYNKALSQEKIATLYNGGAGTETF